MRAQQRKLDIIHEDVGEGASLHWIGPTSSSLVMLYFHGGGYVLPAVYGHFKMVNHFRQEVRKRHDIDVSVAFLEYSLVNHAPWPQQLKQVSAAFTHLLKRGIHPSNIILVGDSVGGHEVAFLLAHILHPHPSVKPVPQLVAPLAGAAMLSPWLSFSEDAPSFARNANSDLMPTKALTKWANLFKNSRGKMDDDNWFEPGEAPAQWWNGLEKIVNNVLITTASGECMLDDIIRAGETMKKGAGSTLKIETFVEEGASHNEILAEFAAGDKPGASTEKVTKWIADVFA
ncbi:Alpha/Beta hydrolase protein [Crassisporium funariophilum]|nr:Alpha/Beta hydrolase protein [Crassisporium funariophilum]